MRAVTGSVASSKRVSVSKAAAILSRFAAAETGARRDVAAYLKRASAAFDDLVLFHREVRDGRRRPERGSRVEEKEARRKKRAGRDGNPNLSEVEGNPRGRPEEEIRWIREVKEEKEVMVDGGDGNLTEVDGDYGGRIGRGEDGKRNSKKKGVNDEKESSKLVGRNEKKMEVEGERRKEEKKRRREMGEEGRDGGEKKRRNSDDGEENEGGGLDDQSERHKKRKKRGKIGVEN